MQGATDAGEGDQSIAGATSDKQEVSNPDARVTKAWNRFLKLVKLSLIHLKILWMTILYRAIMYRRRHVVVTCMQLVIPPLILYGMTVYLGTTLQREEKGWTDYPSLSEQELSPKICGKFCAEGKGVIAIFVKQNKSLFAQKYLPELNQTLNASNIKLIEVYDQDGLLREDVRFHLRGTPDKFIGGIKLEYTNRSTHDERHYPNGIGPNKFVLHPKIFIGQKLLGLGFEGTPSFFDVGKNDPAHYYQFLGIQMALFRTFHKMIQVERTMGGLNNTQNVAIEVKALSYPPHLSYTIKNSDPRNYAGDEPEIDPLLSTIFVMSFIPAFITVVYGPVKEKQNGFKLYLRMMGFSRSAYWFSWIFNQMVIQACVIGILVWLLFYTFDENVGAVVKFGPTELWFLNQLICHFYTLCFSVFLAAFFRRGIMALFISLLIWQLFFHLLQTHMSTFDFGFGFSPFIKSCLIPSGAIHWSIYILNAVSSHSWEVTFQFSLTQRSGFTLLDVMLLMAGNSFVYFFLMLYVDNLHPGALDLGQPWNYFFKGIFCRCFGSRKELEEGEPVLQPVPYVESWTDQQSQKRVSPTIEFERVSKKFHVMQGKGVYGVENVRFKAYPSQITVILGHKDSGRTTLLRLLCGDYEPTSGTILVNGYNVRKHTQKVQSLLGLCMKGDVLCEYLTAMEHMQLVAVLKGLNWKTATEEAKRIFEEVGFYSRMYETVSKLVKRERRILCIVMALLGNAPVLLLDEPTLDLDLEDKRQVWALLRQRKENGTTILMTTEDIEEAYKIANRIVIISRGKVAGVGTPNTLGKLFETGYHLKLVVGPNSNNEEIFSFLEQHIPSVRQLEGSFITKVEKALIVDWSNPPSQTFLIPVVQPDNTKSPSVTLQLKGPAESAHSDPTIMHMNQPSLRFQRGDMQRIYWLPFSGVENFPALFAALDAEQTEANLGIKEYDLQLHGMEKAFNEVDDYVRVLEARRSSAVDELELEDFLEMKALRLFLDRPDHKPTLEDKSTLSRKWCMCWHVLYALMLKRVFHLLGNYRHALLQILGPVLLLILAIQYTNPYFHHHLVSPEITYDTSEESGTPFIPYRYSNGTQESKFVEAFISVIKSSANKQERLINLLEDDFADHFKDESHYKLHDRIITAADFTQLDTPERKVTALFSPGHYHSAPASVLHLMNAILKFEFPEQKFSMDTSGHSMFHSAEWMFLLNDSFVKKLMVVDVDVTLAISMAYGYFIFTSAFGSQPCAERASRLKRYQMYTLKWNGLYWISMAMVDCLFNIIVFTCITLIVCLLPNHSVFRNPEFIILFSITGILGGFASIIASYYWSDFLLSGHTSYYATLSLNQFLGLFTFLIYTLINFEYFDQSYVETVVTVLFQLIQPFTIPWNFYHAILWAAKHGRCAVLNEIVQEELCSSDFDEYSNIEYYRGTCCRKEKYPRGWNLEFIWNEMTLLINVGILFGHCIVGLLFLMYIESKRLNRQLFYTLIQAKRTPELKDPKDLEAVRREEEFVNQLTLSSRKNECFLVNKLRTSTLSRNLLHPISFAVEPGKCTAIVGPETSGITVLYELLAGLRAVSEGDVCYGGHSLFSWVSRKKFLGKLGLCPAQALTADKLTGLQMLKLFARLRGVSSKNLSSHTDYWVQMLGLQQIIKKKCQSYSDVNKRKLTFAVACIGYPPVMIFEEPTKDLDPLSRAQVCRALETLVRENHVVIILSHDLASIQNVCSKVIFLVNGQMQFCGDTEALQAEISKEFTLIVKLKGDIRGTIDFSIYTEFKMKLESEIESIMLIEEKSYSLLYRIKDQKYTWKNLFEILKRLTDDYAIIIQDYQIRRTSLQDVYNSYSVKQQVYRKTESLWKAYREDYCW